MKITRMNPYQGNTKTAAFFDLETDEQIVIKGLTLVDGPNGLFVSLPSKKGKDEQYYDTVTLPKDLRKELNEMAVAQYHEVAAQEA